MTTLDLTRRPSTDPTDLYRYRDALHASDLLIAGLVELDLFTWLDEAPADLEQICGQFGIQPRPTDVMMTLFTAMGLVRRQGNVFNLTPLAREHLVRSSPWWIAPYYASLKDRPVAQDYLRILRTGQPGNWGGLKNEKEWALAMNEPRFAESFTAAMDCRGVLLGEVLARSVDFRPCHRLLDIAGGSGIYASCVVAAHAHLQASVLEKPPVDQITTRLLNQRGFAHRVAVVQGDMFEGIPTGHDAHLFSNVLHDWDVPRVRHLLEASHRALDPGGLLIVHDVHLNADKTGPIHAAEYSALLMHVTEGRCYSVKEMEDFLAQAGFSGVDFLPTAAGRSLITARKTA